MSLWLQSLSWAFDAASQAREPEELLQESDALMCVFGSRVAERVLSRILRSEVSQPLSEEACLMLATARKIHAFLSAHPELFGSVSLAQVLATPLVAREHVNQDPGAAGRILALAPIEVSGNPALEALAGRIDELPPWPVLVSDVVNEIV